MNTDHQHWERPPFTVSTDPARLDIEVIHTFLRDASYWAKGIPRAVVERSIEHSLCFGLYCEREQIGFGRVISDFTTFGWLADVFVLEAWRGRGLSKFLVECVKAHPQLQAVERWMLGTADAHGLYARYGFRPMARPQIFMEMVDREGFRRSWVDPPQR